MIVFIVVMVMTTALVAGLLLAPRLHAPVAAGALPDRPQPFGRKMAWLAIRTDDAGLVLDVLRLRNVEPANWNSGLDRVYTEPSAETHLFVTPPVSGWIFAIGLATPHPLGRSFIDKATPLLLQLGGRFEEVQYFFTYPDIDFFAWARVKNGGLTRAFAIGDEGVIWNKGKLTREERALGLKLFQLRGVRGRHGDAGGELLLHPTQEHVMHLAGHWSLDPTRIDAWQSGPGLGYVGRAPAEWRPQRTRKAA